MTQSAPVLTLAIPVAGPEAGAALRETLDAIQAVWSDVTADIVVQVQAARGSESEFPPDLFQRDYPVQFQTEPDAGIYDAMNRILSRSTTPRILFLGAGDLPLSGLRDATRRWSIGDVHGERLELGGVQVAHPEPGVPQHYPARWDRSLHWRNTAHHQGIAYPTDLLRNWGGYSSQYRVLADYATNLALFQDGIEAHWIPGEDWVRVAPGGVSRQFTPELYAEERRMKADIEQHALRKACQPAWITLKSLWKRWAQRTA